MKNNDIRFNDPMTRREFLKKTVLGLACAGLFAGGMRPQSLFAALEGVSAVQKGNMFYRTLGKTGLSVSEISFNGGRLSDIAVLAYAMDHGVNFIDTAPQYADSEQLISKILKYRKNELIVATKWEVSELFTEQELIASVEQSLKNLNVDTIDIIQTWSAMRATQVNHEPVFTAFEKLKKDGKVRFLGITTHRNEVEVAKSVIENGKYDTLMIGYNITNHEQVDPLIKEAGEKGIGVIAQYVTDYKARIPGEFRGTSRGAAQWALSNPNICSAVMDMFNVQEVDELVRVPAILRK
ncbi:MAG: aldo/keto reductase [Candidatus Auribacter fodinae]|jgi:aryl-alcohol dehydrogenase-like predicted oxidoreductase|uniref:Aldo/keto reductase n=1 Tax=Candidatus Auribacter fodinae TaxID=2093366 RepID=A0A3A4R1F9_9BACT|nr:MAG: aldo/keto reductase [Candidatus Auribacter fodinae]